MSPLDLRNLVAPGVLEAIDPGPLADLLEQEGGAWTAARIQLHCDPSQFPYGLLRELLVEPGAEFPLWLAQALIHVQELAGSPELPAAVEAARHTEPTLDPSASPWSLAVRLWLGHRHLAERTVAHGFEALGDRQGLPRRRSRGPRGPRSPGRRRPQPAARPVRMGPLTGHPVSTGHRNG